MLASRHTLRDVFLAARRQDGMEDFALVTIVSISGSAYRQRGARMIVFPDGSYAGCISSGCLEEMVAVSGKEAIESGRPAVKQIDTRRYYGCDGQIGLLIEPVTGRFIADVTGRIERRTPFVLSSDYSHRLRTEISSPGPVSSPRSHGVFHHLVEPALRIVVVGSGLDAAAMGQVARAVGIEVIHVFPFGDRLDGEPSGEVCVFDPDNLPADPHTGILVMNHHIGRDAETLAGALASRATYVGLLGSRRRCSQVIQAVLDRDPELLSATTRLRAPVGLDIGSETPEEIALSTLSEFSAVATRRDARPLSEKRGSLHDSVTPVSASLATNDLSRAV